MTSEHQPINLSITLTTPQPAGQGPEEFQASTHWTRLTGSGPVLLPWMKLFMVTTTLTNDWLGSRPKTLYITFLWKVNGENEWEIYFRNQSFSKRGATLLALLPLSNDAPATESRYFTTLITQCTLLEYVEHIFILYYRVFIWDFRSTVWLF